MIKDLIALSPLSKVWIYQADRFLTYDELDVVRPAIFDFLDQWTSHNHSLITYGNVFHRRYCCLFVDETYTGASGCSIDKSVHFLEELGRQVGLDFFDRTSVSYIQDDMVKVLPIGQLNEAYSNQVVNDETLFFDHLVKTKEDFLKHWLKPLAQSWHYRFIKKV